MTGTGLFTSNPSGMWRNVTDSGIANQMWTEIFWNEEGQAYLPDGTEIIIQARASNDADDLMNLPYMSFASGDPLNLIGQYLDIKATLSRDSGDIDSPVLSDIRILGKASNGPKTPEPSGIVALLGLSMVSLFSLRRRC